MNKNEFLRAVADKSGETIKAAGEFYNAFVEVVEEAMKKGDKISLVGFGTFEARKHKSRICKNPQTGVEVKVAACVSPAFKFGKSFKDSLN